MIDDEQAEVLTTRDLEKMLKVPRKTQMDLRARGDFIPHFFAGHKVLYRKEAVLRWIAEQEAKARGSMTSAENGVRTEETPGETHQNTDPVAVRNEGNDSPKRWSALDLEPAEQSRWLADSRLPRALSAVSRITAVPAGEPVTGPANPDIIDHLFDATEGIDALRTVEDDEEGQR